MSETAEPNPIVYLVFDKSTGQILHSHTSVDAESGAFETCDLDEVKSFVVDDEISMSQVTDHDPANLDVIACTDEEDMEMLQRRSFQVDPKTKKLALKPQLRLVAKKTELNGDGKDSTSIQIDVLNASNNLMKSYNGSVKVTTSRGKLSVPGGVVDVKGGRGEITLTSVNETVARVRLSARALDDMATQADLDLEFL